MFPEVEQGIIVEVADHHGEEPVRRLRMPERLKNTVEQGISAKQVNEAFQKASIENQSYSAMQQKMSQAAKAAVLIVAMAIGFVKRATDPEVRGYVVEPSASNTVNKIDMQASVAVSNEVRGGRRGGVDGSSKSVCESTR